MLRHVVQHVDCSEPSPGALARWRSAVEDVFPPVHVMPSTRQAFAGRLRSSAASTLRIVDLAASGHAVERARRRQTREVGDYFKISLQLEGSGELEQADRRLCLTPGSIAIYDTGADYHLRFDESYRFLVAVFPKTVLPLPSGLASELVARPLDGDSGIGAVFAAYLRSLAQDLGLLCGVQGERLARAGMDLLTTFVSDSLELSTGGSVDPTRSSLLTEIQHHIRENLHDPELTPGKVAAVHYISVRHLYNLFSPLGTGVAEWIKHERLELVRERLAAPRFSALSVAQVAADCGFPDAAHFGKAFKARYGITPGAWRTSMRSSPSPRSGDVHADASAVHA